jgi:hypothetical protein
VVSTIIDDQMNVILSVSLGLPAFVVASALALPAGADDLAGARDCALYADYHPCTISPLPGGRYAVTQPGPESFEGTLVPQGRSFHLDGTYRFPEGGSVHLAGDIDRNGDSLGGRVKIGTTPHPVEIRPVHRPSKVPPSPLAVFLGTLTTRDAVAAGARLPFRVKVIGAPKFSFTVAKVDDRIWSEKLQAIFGMVPPDGNVGITCDDVKMRCLLTAHSGAEVLFYFVKMPGGPQLKGVELPADGD